MWLAHASLPCHCPGSCTHLLQLTEHVQCAYVLPRWLALEAGAGRNSQHICAAVLSGVAERRARADVGYDRPGPHLLGPNDATTGPAGPAFSRLGGVLRSGHLLICVQKLDGRESTEQRALTDD